MKSVQRSVKKKLVFCSQRRRTINNWYFLSLQFSKMMRRHVLDAAHGLKKMETWKRRVRRGKLLRTTKWTCHFTSLPLPLLCCWLRYDIWQVYLKVNHDVSLWTQATERSDSAYFDAWDKLLFEDACKRPSFVAVRRVCEKISPIFGTSNIPYSITVSVERTQLTRKLMYSKKNLSSLC